MSVILRNGEFTLDAAILADGLGLDPAQVLPAIRDGKITSLCERGTDEDAGRSRLTFFFAQRRFRLVVNHTGDILERRTSKLRESRPAPGARAPK